MKNALLILFTSVLLQSSAQNLVPNPSFEDTLGCPYQWDGILMGYAANWFQPTWGSSDLFTGCHLVPQSFNGYQYANTGSAYAGFIASCHTQFGCDTDNINREYLSVRLLDSLEAGTRYFCNFSVSRADSVQYAATFGVLFSDSLHQASTMNLPYTPHYETPIAHLDRLNWTNYSFSFIAAGGEEFITIGNFRGLQSSDAYYTGGGGDPNYSEYRFAYYYIDDVCLTKDSLNCSGNLGITEIHKSEPILIRILDNMGRETIFKPNTMLIYVYSDGTRKKVFSVN
jgi:hypothetical protein